MDHLDDESRWDYDCPQFVDFTVPVPFNDGADQMFESTIIGEGPSTSTHQFLNNGGPEASPAALGEPEGSHATSEPAVDTQPGETQKAEKATEEDKKARKPSNVVMSLAEWRNPNKHPSSGPDESTDAKRSRKEKTSGPAAGPKKAAPMLTRSKSVNIKKSSSHSSLPADKAAAGFRPERTTRTRTFSQERQRCNSFDKGADRKLKRNTSTTSTTSTASNGSDKSSKVPNLLKRLGERVATTSTSKLKSSEELELERIRQLKKELQHKRQIAQESYKKAMCKVVPSSMAAHSREPTIPLEFHFQTDTRLKAPHPDKEEKGVGDFVKTLRSRTVSPGSASAGAKKLTVPQPFHLTEKYNSKGPTAAEAKFESMAEKVTAFHRKTPERFRARARSEDKCPERGARSVSPKATRLTKPQTPNLTARNRHRPLHYMTQEELEQKELEEMKQNQFKARPVNSKVLSMSQLGVKKVPARATTKVEEFCLSVGTKKEQEEEEAFEFHAQPLNKKILEGPVGIKPVKPAMPTVPQSPAFALKNRVRLPVELPEEKEETMAPLRAKPVPYTGVPYKPKLPHQHTVPEPFSVEERSKAMLAQRDEKIKHILEEEKKAREFHAQPIPSHDPNLPEKAVKECTVPEPFQLETDQRGAYYSQELAHKLTKEEEEQRKAAQFKAQPNRTIYQEPFVPARSNKALTAVSDFELNSDRRAVQREDFENRKKEKEAELEGHRRQREQREKEEEEEAIARLRKEMVHRPNPIRQYAPVVVKPSDKPLTAAESPQFSDRLRAKVRL